MSNAYERPRLSWIKRRARRLQRGYGISRRLAIFDASRDYMDFTGVQARRLLLTRGDKK